MMLKYPFEIRGYGEIKNEDAFELFKEHYLHSMRTLHNMRVEDSKIKEKENIVIHVDGGVVQYVYADHPENLLVTLVDDDNVEQGDVIVYQGNYGVNQIEGNFQEFVENISTETIYVFLSAPDYSKEYEEK
jgi:hypothetical protein